MFHGSRNHRALLGGGRFRGKLTIRLKTMLRIRRTVTFGIWSSRRRSWPQAASIACPFVLRTVTLTLPSRRIVVNRLTLSGIGPVERQTHYWIIRDQIHVCPAVRQEACQRVRISRTVIDATQ